MLTRLQNNFGLKLLAVGLAVAAWGYFHLAASPAITARFDQTLSVPIVATGRRPGFAVRYSDTVASVVLEVPRNGAAVKPDQVRAVIDVSDLTDPGFHAVPVKIVGPEVAIRSLSPASVIVSLDRIEERSVPVSVDYAGGRAAIVVDAPSVSPPVTVVRGTAEALAKVSTVRVVIPIPSRAQPFDAMIRPAPVDNHGNEIGTLDISPSLVRVRARFVQGAAPAAPRPTR